MKIQISDLKAALICAATRDVRYYLNGVYVKSEGGKLTIVSTDGHMLFYSCAPVDDSPAGRQEAIIPAESVKLAISAAGRGAIEIDLDVRTGTLGAVKYAAIDGKYPDYERVIPDPRLICRDNPPLDPFDPRLVVRAHNALAEAMGQSAKLCDPFRVMYNSDSWAAAIMQPADTSKFVLIMPCKASDAPKYLGVQD